MHHSFLGLISGLGMGVVLSYRDAGVIYDTFTSLALLAFACWSSSC